ncbi:MAG: glutamine--fructose-6-phosphate transaminase (isomerizing) [Clostridia bacterium]|nr:glutamine--fructose-6-phosphate transaminase (isomerizing) [Clostridia bacterium]
MCGIVGYTGRGSAARAVFRGLKALEYRGYDSVGIALMHGGRFALHKRVGRVDCIQDVQEQNGEIGIGHTRWATHGGVTEENAHPHVYQRFAVVHNGIIENYRILKEECLLRGERFSSETDSEVIAHLFEWEYRGDLLSAAQRVCRRLRGSYAIAVLCLDFPSVILCAKKDSPLLVGASVEGQFAASDLSAVARKGVTCYRMENGEFSILDKESVSFFGADGTAIEKTPVSYSLQEQDTELGGYGHYMIKEIDEIPQAVERTIRAFKREIEAVQGLKDVFRIHIVGCGTAYHSGIAAKLFAQKRGCVSTEGYLASEYRYGDQTVDANTLVIAVSQSGETADTVAAAVMAKKRGAKLLAITNVAHSTLTSYADCVLHTKAGCEVAVAATKSYNAQLAVLYSFFDAFSACRERIWKGLPDLCKKTIEASRRVKEWANQMKSAKCAYFIGRRFDYAVAMEGSLKWKEITYLPGDGLAAGELKHGTLALVDESTPVVALITDQAVADKTFNAVHEVIARGAPVYVVTSIPSYANCEGAVDTVLIPQTKEEYMPMLSVIPLQLLAYYAAVALGNDPDKPRNLAKSVTVE